MLEGAISGFGHLAAVTTDIGEAAAFADVIMVVIPAYGHRDLARSLAPHLRSGQVIILSPGRTFGAVEFDHALRLSGCTADVTLAETQTLIYAARTVSPGRVRVQQLKNTVTMATLPAWRTEQVLDWMGGFLPQLVPAPHVLQTGMENFGAILHPASTLLNLARIETGEAFDFYHEGITPAVAAVMEAVDAERREIAGTLGLKVISARHWLKETYGCRGHDLFQAIRNNRAYTGLLAPAGVGTRYLHEDVPTGLVPLASLGEFLEVPTPVTNSLINLASLATGADFHRTGRTLDRVGLGNLTLAQIYAHVLEGRSDACRVS